MNEKNILSYLYLVEPIAVSIRKRTTVTVDLEDLIAAGKIGLIEADKTFDPKRNVPYKAYLTQRVRWAILTELRRFGEIPYYQYRQQPHLSFTSNVGNVADTSHNSSEIIDFLIEALNEDELPVLYALAGGMSQRRISRELLYSRRRVRKIKEKIKKLLQRHYEIL